MAFASASRIMAETGAAAVKLEGGVRSSKQIKRIVRLEAVITSLMGASLGVVMGVLFALVVSRPLENDGFVLTFPVATLALLLVLAAAFGIVAAIAPARRAARLEPGDIIRGTSQ